MAKSGQIGRFIGPFATEHHLIFKQLDMKNSKKRVPLSPRESRNGLNFNDLGLFSFNSRDKSGTDTSSDITLYDAIQELSERKKMHFFNPIPLRDYRGCTLTEGKEWFVSYYVTNPDTGKLKRIRVKVNRIQNIRERRKAAKAMMAAIDMRLALGWNPLLEASTPNAYTTLFKAFDSFLKIKGKEMEENSMRSYTSFIKTFKAWLQQHGFTAESYACAITKEVALTFMNELEENLSAKTFNNYIGFYRSLFNWMISKGYCSQNPFTDVKKKAKRLTKKKRRILSDDELSALFTYLQTENEAYLAACLICYSCFIRPKELCLLKCRDIDLRKQVIHVNQDIAKNDNDSYRTIPDDLIPVLSRIDLSHPDWFVFGQHNYSDFGPGPVKRCSRSLAKFWELHVRKACGFGQDLQFYSLKDTGITNMLGDGVPINLVQQQADHSSVAMTAIYVGQKAEATEELKETSIIPHERCQ